MTREYIKEEMAEIIRVNQLPFRTFYLRYTNNNGGITSNVWGTMDKFEKAMKKAEESDDCIQGSLPIKLLVLTNDRCVFCWTKNPLWDCVNDFEEHSHVFTNVPLIGTKCFIDPKDWLDMDNRIK